MESLWRLEDKWKLSTPEAALLLVCATSLLMGVCAASVLKRRKSVAKKNQLVEQTQHLVRPEWSGCICSWGVGSVKRVLMETVRWSGASKWKWEEHNVAQWQEGPSPSPLLGRGPVSTVGWQSNNSESPVWQRPILMGEKCEMPRFSGLILYDERGQPLPNEPAAYVAETKQEKSPAKERTTLRDLL